MARVVATPSSGVQPVTTSQKNKAFPYWATFALSASAGTSGWMFVHPFDVLKVRMQLMGETAGAAQAKHTMASTAKHLIKTEGPLGLYSGLSAAVMRQCSYGTMRLGFYDIIKTRVEESQGAAAGNLATRMLCGMGAGAVASFLACPIEVCLVRMQADGRLPVDQRRNYKNVLDALVRVGREEGVRTYWRGATPTVTRAMLVTSTQLATYDQAKSTYGKFMDEGVPLHLASSLTAGFVYCAASLPLDTTKTRMQNQSPGPDGRLPYRSVPQTLGHIVKHEGVASLWKGFLPYFARGGGHTIGMMVFLEQYRKLARGWFADSN